ncbi:MAG: oligosaccharide flippase family protein, partial [Pseudomonadota bacterium]
IVRGGGITLIGFGAGQALRLASNLIMTRLLTADAFGLMAITISLQVLMVMMSDVGINASIIRSPSATRVSFLSTAWVSQIVRGIIIALILFFFAIFLILTRTSGIFNADTVFADPRLPVFLFVIAGTSLLDGLRSVKMVLYQRELKMGRIVSLELGAQVCAIVAMLMSYSLGAGAYALVIGAAAAVTVTLFGSHLFFSGPTIGFDINRADFAEIFNFGKWLLVASIAGFITQRGDQFIFGAIMDKGTFGLYSIATIWITLVIVLFDIVQNRITFPAFSEVWRDRKEDMTRLYYRFRLVADVACFSIFLCILFFADFLFDIIYPDEYAGVVSFIKYLALVVLLLPYRILTSILLADGKGRSFMTITLIPATLMLLAPLIYRLTSVPQTIVYVASLQLATIPISWYLVRQHIKLNFLYEGWLILVAFGFIILFLNGQ